MKKSSFVSFMITVFSMLFFSGFFTDCKKSEDPAKYTKGTFPDTVFNIIDINSAYDDYNTDLDVFRGNSPVIFSSNRKSSGGQFDLEQAVISFMFDKVTGVFDFQSGMTNNAFLSKLITSAVTPANDFGPYRLFSPIDGFEYLVLSSVTTQGKLDLFYLKNLPVYGSSLPAIEGPVPVRLFNSASDDAYFCFDSNMDTAYFTSDRNGNFDIFQHSKPAGMEVSKWLTLDFSASAKTDSVNSASEDKCPLVFKNIMIFTSNRPGGFGGYDLYYSVSRKGKWSSPLNLGPGINTASDEYRPVIGYHPDFTNNFVMFSSNRPGGKGGFDLYFTGVNFPE